MWFSYGWGLIFLFIVMGFLLDLGGWIEVGVLLGVFIDNKENFVYVVII